VWGSVLWTLFPIIPIIDLYHPLFPGNEDNDDTPLPITDDSANYILVMSSGIFFVVGSLFFVRSFYEPKFEAFFAQYGGCCLVNFGTDEQAAAWFFLIGTIPALPIVLVYIYFDPYSFFNWFSLVCTILLVIGTYLFVLAVYPEMKEKTNQFFPDCVISVVGKDSELVYHMQNDWIVGCWVFFYGTLITTIWAAFFFVAKLYSRNYYECYVFFTTFIDCIIFVIGSMYFVAGSYPMTDKTIDEALADSDEDKPEGVTRSASFSANTSKVVGVVDAVQGDALADVFSPVVADDIDGP